MAYVDGFEHDIFLSYARVDDQTATAGERGWVSAFEEHLRVALDRRAGRIGKVKVWRDLGGIDGNQLFDRTIEEALDASAVFVALTSRGYLESEYCRQELGHFHRRAGGDRFGLAVGDRLRIVNVQLTDVPRDEWPEEFGRTSGFDAHDAEDNGRPGEPSEPSSPLFKRQVRALADALYDMLKAMRKTSRPAGEPAASDRGTVYLADVADTLRDQIDKLSHDLKQRGIEVVSGVPPPYDAIGHEKRVIEELEGVDLTVHLLDEYAGRKIDGGAGATYPRRQVELAGKHGCARTIWLPEGLDPTKVDNEAHGSFLQELERGKGGGDADDFVRGLRADLAGQIVERVEHLRSAARAGSADGDEASCLLVTHTRDTAHMLPVAETLMGEGIEPFINQEANEPKAVLELFEGRLRNVASLIIFYGEVRRRWVRERLDTAIKIGAKDNPDLRLAVFAAPPEKPPEDLRFSRGFIHVETIASARDALSFVGGGV
ncbi:MAG: toll/interleukin-1 receptor domain-containing protein [bacterium]|nr:toll/interleukin-1 receptor domain-containing protein [bacterium]